MPFITIPVQPKEYQFSFDDILNGVKKSYFEGPEKRTGDTRTVYREITPQRLLDIYDFNLMLQDLKAYNLKYKHLIETEDKSKLYYSFKLPKRSGGFRPIDAPEDELMFALRELKYLLETKLFASHHTCAFAYIKGRSTANAVMRHKNNASRWFLKLDFSNFFGSTTLDFVMRQLELMFPYNHLMLLDGGKDELRKAISLCFLRGGLPQGTPISPTITNLMMIPIDHHIAKEMREHTPHIVYTRYADDLHLSADISFKWTEVQEKIIEILKKYNAPFTIKKEKTHYGSSAGRNWILGVMLNKDNEITVGHVKKKYLKAALFSIYADYTNGKCWDAEDTQKLGGEISYYMMIEKDNIQKILDKFKIKYKRDVFDVIKDMLKRQVPAATKKGAA